MTEIVQFETGQGPAFVEVAEDSIGTERLERDEVGVLQGGKRLDEALQAARPAIRAVLPKHCESSPQMNMSSSSESS